MLSPSAPWVPRIPYSLFPIPYSLFLPALPPITSPFLPPLPACHPVGFLSTPPGVLVRSPTNAPCGRRFFRFTFEGGRGPTFLALSRRARLFSLILCRPTRTVLSMPPTLSAAVRPSARSLLHLAPHYPVWAGRYPLLHYHSLAHHPPLSSLSLD